MRRLPARYGIFLTAAIVAAALCAADRIALSQPSEVRAQSSVDDQTARLAALLAAANAARSAGDLDTAIAQYKQVVAISPRSVDAWLGLGAAEVARHDIEAGAEAYRSAQVIDDGNVEAALSLGNIALAAMRPSLAAEEFEHGIKFNKQDPKLNNGAAIAYALQGKYELARQHYDAALAVEPSNPSLKNNYGLLQLRTGDLQGALATFMALRQSFPENSRYRINLSLVYLALGRTNDALRNAPDATEQQLRQFLAAYYRQGAMPLALAETASKSGGDSAKGMTPADGPKEALEKPRPQSGMALADQSAAEREAPTSLADVNPTAGANGIGISEPEQAKAAATQLPARGIFRIQVASVPNEEGAAQEWKRLKNIEPELLSNLSLTLSRADLGARGVFYRLQVGPLPDASEAERLCAALRDRKLGCLVVRP